MVVQLNSMCSGKHNKGFYCEFLAESNDGQPCTCDGHADTQTGAFVLCGTRYKYIFEKRLDQCGEIKLLYRITRPNFKELNVAVNGLA